MTKAPLRSLTGRGDLLRVLKTLGADALDAAAPSLGYERIRPEPREEAPVEAPRLPMPPSVTLPEASPPPRPTFRARYWALTKAEDRPVVAAPQWYREAKDLSGDHDPNWRAPPRIPLLPWSRLGAWLRRRLGEGRPSREPDIGKITRWIAAGRPLRRMPERMQHAWVARCCLLLDHAPHLWPYRDDINEIWRRLSRLRGRGGIDIRLMAGAASERPGVRTIDVAPGAKGRTTQSGIQPWRHPPPGVPLLVLGDLGMLAPAPEAQAGWLRFGAALQRAGVPAVALCPVPADRVPSALARRYAIHEWDRSARLAHAVHPGNEPAPSMEDANAVEALLDRIAPTLRVEAPLLRSMRIGLRSHAVVEADLLRHADVLSDGALLCLAGVAAAERRGRAFKDLPCAEQRRIADLIQTHHGATPSLAMTERGLVDYFSRQHDEDDGALSQAERDALCAYRSSLVKYCHENSDKRFLRDYWLPDNLARQSETLIGSQPQLQALWVLSQRAALQRDGRLALPPGWADNPDLNFFLDPAKLPPRACCLVQVGDRLQLEAAPKTSPTGATLAECVLQGDQVTIMRGGAESETVIMRAARLPVELTRLDDELETLTLDLGVEKLRLKEIARPAWANAMARDKQGLWAEFTIATDYGRATQRLRWIEPGSFWMGSPQDEPERFEDEGPRHRVSLTQGFWLADSACTQALWQAAMGNNPSHFQGEAQRPVERVSWREVQDFLRRLEASLPGCRAELPSEAEWEYACRAGSETPFSFGAQIGPEQVNYNGNFPYAAGEKGLNRTQTVAVKSLPPNAWGLYEMHGNVWEWCADGQRAYTADAQQDPRGDESAEARRAVRGGAWNGLAGGARSAFRNAIRPGFADHLLGFRLSLRSIESGPVRFGGTAGGEGFMGLGFLRV